MFLKVFPIIDELQSHSVKKKKYWKDTKEPMIMTTFPQFLYSIFPLQVTLVKLLQQTSYLRIIIITIFQQPGYALIRANSPGYGRTGRDPLIWFYQGTMMVVLWGGIYNICNYFSVRQGGVIFEEKSEHSASFAQLLQDHNSKINFEMLQGLRKFCLLP